MTATPATFGLLGMLAVRPWTGYELTRQVRRSLRFVWPLSEGHLYREQRRLVELGWATVEREAAGRTRSRNRYTITEAGRTALRDWLATEPEEPHFQIEAVLRTFFADQGSPEDLAAAMRHTARMAASMRDEILGFVDEYLADGGPLWMLENGVGGPSDRLEFHGRPMFPERLHVVALAMDVTTQLLDTVDRFFAQAADRVETWPTTRTPAITPDTRAVLEAMRARRGG